MQYDTNMEGGYSAETRCIAIKKAKAIVRLTWLVGIHSSTFGRIPIHPLKRYSNSQINEEVSRNSQLCGCAMNRGATAANLLSDYEQRIPLTLYRDAKPWTISAWKRRPACVRCERKGHTTQARRKEKSKVPLCIASHPFSGEKSGESFASD